MKKENHKTNDNMSSGKLLLGVLAGAAAGALLGVLLAPEKGSDTRAKLAQMGDDYAGDITDKIRELRDSISEKIDSLKNEGENALASTGSSGTTGSTGTGRNSSGSTGSGSSSGSGSRSGGGYSSSGSQTL